MARSVTTQPSRTDAGWARRLGPTVLSSTAAVAAALLVGALFILFSGQNPLAAYRALFNGAFSGRRAIAETLVAVTPYLFGGLAFAVAFRAGMFNIGIEGQLVMGSLAAGLVGALNLGLPAAIHLPLALLAAAAAGGIWGAIPGLLKAVSGAHEVITTIMLNYLAYRVSSYATLSAGRWLPVNAGLQATDPVRPAANLPNILHGTRLHAGIILAIAAAGVLWYLLFRTTFGYRVRTVGLSRGAAAYAGISWGRTITLAMFASGVLAGLAGAGETLGLLGRHYKDPQGYGFTAIAAGLVGRNHPIGVILSGVLFGVLRSGANKMQNTAGTSKELVQVLQGLVILSVAAFAATGRVRGRREQRRAETEEQPGQTATVGAEPEAGPPAL